MPRHRKSTSLLALISASAGIHFVFTMVLIGKANRALVVPKIEHFFPANQRPLKALSSQTFSQHCSDHKLFNSTWGSRLTKFVDKYDTKLLVDKMSSDIDIVPTIALYDASNISRFSHEEFLSMASAKNLIIKPTHAWARTARVWNQTYECYRMCKFNDSVPISLVTDGKVAHKVALDNMHQMFHLPSREFLQREPQYKGLPKRVIVEEHLDRHMNEYHWWVVHGQPVFVCARCDTPDRKQGSYYTSDFRKLSIRSALHPCTNISRPVLWDRMVKVVKELGSNVPGLVSIDVYANSTHVYFSEFTFSRASCSSSFKPWTADALLYNMEHGIVDSKVVTPEYVLSAVHDRSWVLIQWDWHSDWSSEGFPSAVDACLNQDQNSMHACLNHSAAFQTGLGEKHIQCVLSSNRPGHGHSSREIQMFGLSKDTSLARVFHRVDWPWALIVLVWISALLLCDGRVSTHPKYLKVYTPPRWSYSLVYIGTVAVYKSQQVKFEAWWDPGSTLWSTAVQSFEVFRIVHSVESTGVCLSHFCSYWIPLVAIIGGRNTTSARTFQWWLVYELGTAMLNEWFHHQEPVDALRCTRVAFIGHAKQYVWNDIVRVYILPPFFVYGYLLPRFIVHCLGLASAS